MAQFHSMTVTGLHKTIRNAVVLDLRPEEPEHFPFLPGQYLTFRQHIEGHDIRRTYSICSTPGDEILQVGIKQVEGGAFSTWANEVLQVGDRLEVMAPMGNFHIPPAPETPKHYLAFAGGSGITPILSILRTVLETEPQADFTLVYANRAVSTIMFREELEDLKNRFMGRLNIINILESDGQDIDLFAGRVDADKCEALFGHWIPIETVNQSLICGPQPMMDVVKSALVAHGQPEDAIKFELFASAQTGRLPKRAETARAAHQAGASATAIIAGESRQFRVAPEQTLLQSALANDLDAPFACTAGVCSTCRAKVLEGCVEMANNHALEDDEVTAGYVLTCQSYVLSDKVIFDYDQ